MALRFFVGSEVITIGNAEHLRDHPFAKKALKVMTLCCDILRSMLDIMFQEDSTTDKNMPKRKQKLTDKQQIIEKAVEEFSASLPPGIRGG